MIILKEKELDMKKTLECGQIFRWRDFDNGKYGILVGDKALLTEQKKDCVIFHNINEQEFSNYWENYFDLNRNLKAIKATFPEHSLILDAVKEGAGIRILRQDPFETIISFIISSNNHIPRIRTCIETLAKSYGKKMDTPWGEEYSFPEPKVLAQVPVEEFREKIKVGYRDRYISETSKLIAEGFPLEKLSKQNFQDALKTIKLLPGIGDKVGECVLLFAYGHMEAFPKDVWIKRAMSILEKDGLSEDDFGDHRAYLQQYLFHYMRSSGEKAQNSGLGKN